MSGYKHEIGDRVDICTYDGVWGKASVIDRRVNDFGDRDYKVKMEPREEDGWAHPDFWAFGFEVYEIKTERVAASDYGDGSRWEEL